MHLKFNNGDFKSQKFEGLNVTNANDMSEI